MASTISCDVAIVGGGLAGGLIALALQRLRPDVDIKLIDGGDRFGGNHVWSFFGSDVAQAHRWLLAPLVVHRWPGYDVAFPAHVRRLNQPYYSIESERLDAVLRDRLPEAALMPGRKVASTSATQVALAGGDRIEARGVIDARGAGDLAWLDLGWQKFVGQELALARPHGRDRPVVMDASVAQIDGYRFVYALPFAERRMFVEDTYYADGPELDIADLRDRIAGYAAAKGWAVESVVREEVGALPVAMGGDFDRYWQSGGKGLAKAGMRAGLFHPTTGYSLPDAVRAAIRIAGARDLSGAALHDLTHAHARHVWRSRRFYRLLDRMLFRAAEPAERYRVLQRFYRLDPRLIGRFYAGRSTMRDKARILMGRPPVPMARALGVVRER